LLLAMAAPPALSRHGTSPLCCSSVGYTEPAGGAAGAAGAVGSGQASEIPPDTNFYLAMDDHFRSSLRKAARAGPTAQQVTPW
jgi:hypothetical protein